MCCTPAHATTATASQTYGYPAAINLAPWTWRAIWSALLVYISVRVHWVHTTAVTIQLCTECTLPP